jgi:hypothetical protein
MFLHLLESAQGVLISLVFATPFVEFVARKILTFIAEFQSLLVNATQEYPAVCRPMFCSVSLTAGTTDVLRCYLWGAVSAKPV